MDLTHVVDPDDPVRVSRLRIRNEGSSPARLRIYAYAEWVLGTHRSKTAGTVVPSQDAATGALFARNPYGLDFGGRIAFDALGAWVPRYDDARGIEHVDRAISYPIDQARQVLPADSQRGLVHARQRLMNRPILFETHQYTCDDRQPAAAGVQPHSTGSGR